MNTEPILSSSGIVAAISAIVAMLMGFGVLQWAPEQRDLVMAAIVAILGVVGPLAAGFWARTQTTPLADPKIVTPEGREVPLVRADTNQPTPQAMLRSARIER